MRVTHKIVRTKAGMLGGSTVFAVHIKATLAPEEQATIDEFGASTGFEISDRFESLKGANHGFLNLRDFTGGSEFKLPNIQQASDFVAQVLNGLQQVKNQIDATRASADKLDQEFTEEL